MDCFRHWIGVDGDFEMSKEKFERTKPVVNVGTIGHVDHGKTKLTAAVATAIAANLASKSVDDVNEKLTRGLTKERDDWRKWRQSGSKYKSVINGVRRGVKLIIEKRQRGGNAKCGCRAFAITIRKRWCSRIIDWQD